MARDKQPFEASSEAAEKTFEQNVARAQGAMDNYLRFLQNMCSPDLTEKMRTYTEQNISASTDCVQKLSRAKDFQEVLRIQTEFMQRQMNSFAVLGVLFYGNDPRSRQKNGTSMAFSR